MGIRDERGIALLAAVMTMMLLTALGAGLVLTTSTEAMIAANFRTGVEARYAASSIAEVARAHLAGVVDWDRVLDGSTRSVFADGPPAGERVLAGGTRVDLSRTLNLARCGRPTVCADTEMNARTARRPWGPNNPRWQLYAYGYFPDLTGISIARTALYVIALVGDDGLETDGEPARDGSGPDNPGAGILIIRAEAFGASGARATVELTIARQAGSGSTRVLSWRQL